MDADGRSSQFNQAIRRLEDSNSPVSAARQFEELVFSLLDAGAKADNYAPVERYRAGREQQFDGVLPEGLPPFLVGPTALEIAYIPESRGRETSSLLARRLAFATSEAARARVGSLLVVVNQPLSSHEKHRLAAPSQGVPGLQVEVWDRESLEQLAARYDEAASLSADALFLRTVERSARSSEDWRGQAKRLLQDLKETYHEEGVAFVLGAGVSGDSGLPSWADLVGSLFTLAFDGFMSNGLTADEAAVLFSAASELNSNSPLQTARYLRRALAAQGVRLEAKVTELLYAKYDPSRLSPLLQAIAAMCTPERTGPRVHGVVTYNFDDLLETSLSRRYIKAASIYRQQAYASPDELAVYHVHGFLPRDPSPFEGLDESLLAFSEEGYHQLYADPYHWTNIVQLNLFRERTCIMVGLSLTDPNLRRLLEIASRGGTSPRHFALMRRISEDSLLEQNGAVSNVDSEARREFLSIHHALQEQIFAEELGVSVIWLDSFADMSSALIGLRDS